MSLWSNIYNPSKNNRTSGGQGGFDEGQGMPEPIIHASGGGYEPDSARQMQKQAEKDATKGMTNREKFEHRINAWKKKRESRNKETSTRVAEETKKEETKELTILEEYNERQKRRAERKEKEKGSDSAGRTSMERYIASEARKGVAVLEQEKIDGAEKEIREKAEAGRPEKEEPTEITGEGGEIQNTDPVVTAGMESNESTLSTHEQTLAQHDVRISDLGG